MNNLKKALNTNYLSIIGKRSILNKNKKDEELRLIEKGSTDNSFKLKNLEGTANGVGAISFGYKTKSEGNFTYSEGIETKSVGEGSHSEGIGIEEFDIDILGNNTSYSYLLPAEVKAELVIGCGIKYNNIYAYITNISGNTITVSETLGNLTSYKSAKIFSGEAIGRSSHSEGSYCNSIGTSSHSEGSYCNSKGIASHAEGNQTEANGNYSHSEGNYTSAIGVYSHAEGNKSISRGSASHAEGYNCFTVPATSNTLTPGTITTNSAYAHAEGNATHASGIASHTEGKKTFARNNSEHAQGQFNKSNYGSTTFGDARNTIHSIGIGTSDSDRRNAVEVGQNGEVYIIGVGGYNGTNMNTGVNSLQKVLEGLGVTIDWTAHGYEVIEELPEE